jgi:hypothetical protein
MSDLELLLFYITGLKFIFMIVNSVEKVSYADQAGKTDGIYEITADSPCYGSPNICKN